MNKFIKISNLQLNEMSNLRTQETGIDNVVMYVGPRSDKHWHRVKVSNIPNKYSSDNFVISIPEYSIVEGTPDKWVKKQLPSIIEFVKLNETLIIEFSEKRILFDEFLTSLKKINQPNECNT